MTIIEALKISKEADPTGENSPSFMRVSGGGGFVRWWPNWDYKFTGEDLIADDWESVETGIPKLTGGRWGAAIK